MYRVEFQLAKESSTVQIQTMYIRLNGIVRKINDSPSGEIYPNQIRKKLNTFLQKKLRKKIKKTVS